MMIGLGLENYRFYRIPQMAAYIFGTLSHLVVGIIVAVRGIFRFYEPSQN